MPIRIAEAHWKGGLKSGRGSMQVGSGAFEGRYSFGSRFKDEGGTNPEELIGAAHAGCYSMALSALLEESGHTPDSIDTRAKVHIHQKNGGFKITRIELETEVHVQELDGDEFKRLAQTAKENCPVSQALTGVEILLYARLK